jgi:RimJ/RimL family protein N-acetyltransferase
VWREPELIGNRVLLRVVHAEDAPGILDAAIEDRSTYEWTWVPSSLDNARASIEQQRSDHAGELCIPFVVIDQTTMKIVGQTRYLDLDWLEDRFASEVPHRDADTPPRAVEIGGTWYAASAQRTFVNPECKLLMLAHAFDGWNVERVSFKTDARNERSRRAIVGIGAKFEGVRRAHMRAADGRTRDSAYFSIVRSEWEKCRSMLEARLSSAP